MFGLVSSCAFLVFYLNIVSIEKDNYVWIAYIIKGASPLLSVDLVRCFNEGRYSYNLNSCHTLLKRAAFYAKL